MTDALVVDLAALPHLDMLVSDEAQRRYAELRPALLAVSPTGFLGFLHYDDALATLSNQRLRPMAPLRTPSKRPQGPELRPGRPYMPRRGLGSTRGCRGHGVGCGEAPRVGRRGGTPPG